MNHGQWTKGKPIPHMYRNKLYAWEGGGYDGCIWEMNHGLVTESGHWDPFNSSGFNGLDCDDWHQKSVRELKSLLGFHVDRYGYGEDVDAWYSHIKYSVQEEARKKYYGEDYHNNPDYYNRDAKDGEPIFPDIHKEDVDVYVNEHTIKEKARYDEYKSKRAEIDREWHERLDEMFMDQIKAQEEKPLDVPDWTYSGPARSRWSVYSLDDESIKKACAQFCKEYSGTVAVMAGVLDKLSAYGYDVWCTCTDCGEQFQLSDYEKFSHLIDQGMYHGDGGIGCIFTRIQCEDCRRETECPQCYDPNLPTYKQLKDGTGYKTYSFKEKFIAQWIGVCDNCACNFFYKPEYEHWKKDVSALEYTISNARTQLDKYIAVMREKGVKEDELNTIAAKNLAKMREEWIQLVNELRDEMQPSVQTFFSDCCDWANNRLDKNDATYVF